MTSTLNLLMQIAGYGLLFTLRKAISILDFFYPKDNQTIVFGSDFTDRVSGDPKAMFEKMRAEHPKYHVFFITKFPSEAGHIQSNTLRALLIFLRARFCVTSHGLSDFGFFKWSRRKKAIATWHAITFKACGYTQKNRTKLMKHELEQYTKTISASIAGSKYDASIHSLMFGYGGRMFLTGHPRNDKLVDYISGGGKNHLREILPDITNTDTIILYAPTFRSEVIQQSHWKSMFFPNIRIKEREVRLFPFNDFDVQAFNNFLQEKKVILLLRLHIGDSKTQLEVEQLVSSSERIICFDYESCPDINSVLSDIDFVVTDYSSIFYDFLLLNRPMLFIPYDLKDYVKQRGLIVDDYDLWTPGPKVSSMKEFIEYVRLCISGGVDPYENERHRLNKIINAHQTANSTIRILKLMKYLNKGNY